jgi:hypothetical protein
MSLWKNASQQQKKYFLDLLVIIYFPIALPLRRRDTPLAEHLHKKEQIARVTRWVRKKIAQNAAETRFLTKINSQP